MASIHPAPQVISFDVWLTLLKSNPAFKAERCAIIAAALGHVNKVALVTQIANTVDIELDLITEKTGKDFDFKARFLAIAQKMNATTSFLDAEIALIESKVGEAFIRLMPTVIEADIVSTLESLKDMNIKIALVSNTGFISGSTMRIALEKLGILPFVDYCVFSNEVGVAKPHPDMFKALISISGVSPESILHIGDNLENDYHGALKVGMRALHFGASKNVNEDVQSISSLSDLLNSIVK